MGGRGDSRSVVGEVKLKRRPTRIQRTLHRDPSREVEARSRRCPKSRGEQGRLTRDVPQVSAFANSRGKTRKSTARIQMTVIIIMIALYDVTKGFEKGLTSNRALEPFREPLSGIGESGGTS